MGRVLVVDDNRETAEAVRRLLKHCGHQAVAIDDGAKAIDWLASEPSQPDLILLDWMMPNVGGADVLRAIRADPLYQNVRVVIFSASYEFETVSEATRLGADDYIAKGAIRWDQMVRTLERHMHVRREGGTPGGMFGDASGPQTPPRGQVH
jgi:CheY-like chemotaxis protein